jgi:SAM-dependent methyltransferase
MDFKERVRRRNEFDASLVYGTKQFNLLTGRDKHANWRNKHDDQWLDPATGLIRERFARTRKCPLCGSDKHELMFIKSGFPHVRCSGCSLAYVTPILNQEEYVKLWSAEDSWEEVLESTPQVKMQTLEAKYSLDIAEQHLTDKKDVSICDVGCGPGTLLEEAKRRGHKVFGIEPNVRCHKVLARKGIDHLGDFFPLKKLPDMAFSCVFLLNTLEHLHDPLGAIAEVKKMLKPGGLLYISVPTIEALVSRIMHEKAGVFGGHSHVQFFDIKTLSLLVEKAGYSVVEYETIITEIGVIKNYLGYCDPYFGDTPDKFDFLTPEAIYRNHMGRNLNLVARAK